MDNDKISSPVLWALVIVVIMLLTGCKGKQTIVTERYAVHDTVWSVRNSQAAQRDSIVYYEFVNIRPHVLKLRDTTIVYMDTVINRSSVFNHYNNIFHSEDKGRVTRDTAYIEKPVDNSLPRSGKAEEVSRPWKTLLVGIIIGVLLSIAWKHRKKLRTVVKRIKSVLG